MIFADLFWTFLKIGLFTFGGGYSMVALPKYYQIQRYAMPVFLIIVLVVPYIFNFNPIGIYLNFTAGNLANLMLP